MITISLFEISVLEQGHESVYRYVAYSFSKLLTDGFEIVTECVRGLNDV